MPDSKEFKKREKADEKKRRDGTKFPDLSEDEKKARDRDVKRLSDAKSLRDSSHPEFNGMSYVQAYERAMQADMAYIPPKLNEGDVRVVTGITREKDNSLLANLLNYNFEASVTAYDSEGKEMDEVAQAVEAMVRKSREMEDYDGKRDLIYRELIATGDAFTAEEWVETERVERSAKFDWRRGVNLKSYESSAKLVREPGYACTTLIPGTKVYKGDIRKPGITGQPFVFTAELVHYNDCLNQFSKWERWENVPTSVSHMDEGTETTYRDWTLLEGTAENYVEVLKVYDVPRGTFQLYLSGVPMLPPDFPLAEVSPDAEYPITQGSCERVPFFGYSKGIPSKTFVEQSVIDEMLKLAVLKTQQSFKPPMGNSTGFEIGPEMFLPGYVSDSSTPIKEGGLVPLVPANGVTSSEMAMMEYMKGILDLKSVSAEFSGEGSSGDPTATQVLEEKKAAINKLGLVVWGVVQFETLMARRRIATVLSKWDEAKTSLKAVARFSYETPLENGRQGRRVYDLDADMAKTVAPERVMLEEEMETAASGIPTRITYVDVKGIRNAKLVFKVTVTPTEKETSDVQKLLFVKNVSDAATLFGPQSLNLDYLKGRFATLIGEDPDKFFVPPEQAMAPQPGMRPLGPQGAPGAAPVPGMPQAPSQSLNAQIA